MKAKGLKFKIRKLFLVLANLIFAWGILLASVLRIHAQVSSLNFKIKTAPETIDTTVISTSSPSPTVDYYLPYPGILPDNILYPLKMIRDRIWLIFTFDPVKKVERLLLFADKRLNASKSLIEGGKVELGISTMTKGEKYLEQAIIQIEKAQKAGKDTTFLFEKLAKASLKHQEVLMGFLAKVPEEARGAIREALRYSRQSYETISRLKEQERQQNQGEKNQIQEEERGQE